MIEFKIICDKCNKSYSHIETAYPKTFLKSYQALKEHAVEAEWIYENKSDTWYCPPCAEYYNKYSGNFSFKNKENNLDWHYTAGNDYPPIHNMGGISDTVIDQNGEKVFYTINSGWLYENPVNKTYADVYKWKYK